MRNLAVDAKNGLNKKSEISEFAAWDNQMELLCKTGTLFIPSHHPALSRFTAASSELQTKE